MKKIISDKIAFIFTLIGFLLLYNEFFRNRNFFKNKNKTKKNTKKTNPEILVFSSTSLPCPVTFFTVILNAHALFQQNKSITI